MGAHFLSCKDRPAMMDSRDHLGRVSLIFWILTLIWAYLKMAKMDNPERQDHPDPLVRRDSLDQQVRNREKWF
jgi:hypothetical protein